MTPATVFRWRSLPLLTAVAYRKIGRPAKPHRATVSGDGPANPEL